MPDPSIKTEHAHVTYVTLKQKGEKKSKGTTVYGMTPEQVLEAIRIGVEQLNRQKADAA